MKKTNKTLLLSIVCSTFLWSNIASAQLLGQLLKQGSQSIDTVLERLGVSGAAATQIKDSLSLSLTALNKGKYPKSESNLEAILRFDDELVQILAKDVDQLTKRDLSKLVNRTSVEAEISGKAGSYLSCNTCVDDVLADLGVKIVTQKVSASTGRILKQVPSDLNKSIKRLGQKIGMKDIDGFLSSLNDVDKKKAWVALKKIDSPKGKDEKAFVDAYVALNTVEGSTFYHNNKLWSLLVDEVSADDLARFTRLFNKVSEEAPVDPANGRMGNLRNWFENKAAEDPKLADSLEKLKKKNCWKIF